MIDYDEYSEYDDADELSYRDRVRSIQFRRARTERRKAAALRKAEKDAES